MRKIDKISDLTTGSIIVCRKYVQKESIASVYLLLGIREEDIQGAKNSLTKSDICIYKNKQDLLDNIKNTLGVSLYFLGSFLWLDNTFLCEKWTIEYIKILLKKVLGELFTGELRNEYWGNQSIRRIMDNIILDEINVPSKTVMNWLLKSAMIKKTPSYIDVNKAVQCMTDFIMQKYNNQLQILSDFDTIAKNNFNDMSIKKEYNIGDIIVKYTPKMVKFYLVLGFKYNECYILQIEQTKKSDISSQFYFSNIISLIKYGFRNKTAEILDSKIDYYFTGINVASVFGNEILKELESC